MVNAFHRDVFANADLMETQEFKCLDDLLFRSVRWKLVHQS